MKFVAVILTFNEEKHLLRCISSLSGVVDEIVIVDCFSSDATLKIAQEKMLRVIQHEWVNYAIQFNFALTQLAPDTEWVLRIDADEYLTPQLALEIKEKLSHVDKKFAGIYLNRRMTFQGKLIRHGGVFPVRVIRLFRYGRGECEKRWMDEHIKVDGDTLDFHGELIDDNLNNLTWWTAKHNLYANREAVDLLNLEFGFMHHDSVGRLHKGKQVEVKRWFKETIYARLPGGFRAFLYFFYRYIVRMGFLDGSEGMSFHFLQGFWYRYLVDAKVAEVKRYMKRTGQDAKSAIKLLFDITIE